MAKRNRSRRAKASAADQRRRPTETPWSDVEEAFFASAPPETPTAPAEPERFDDLEAVSAVPARHRPRAELHDAFPRLRQLVDTLLTAPWLNRRNITIAIASFMLLVGLSAVVFASR